MNREGKFNSKRKFNNSPKGEWRNKESFKSRSNNKFEQRFNHNAKNDDKPLQLSTKRRPPPLKIFDVTKPHRDPRFEETSGEFNPVIFNARYGPLIAEARDNERNELLKLMKKEKNPEAVENIKYLLQRMNNKMENEKSRAKKDELTKKLKEAKKSIVKSGPIYLRKSEIKQAELVDKFNELKKSGKLDKYLERKRKKNAARERKKMNTAGSSINL